MRYAYYPGCSLHSTAREYDMSLRAVCEKVGVELKEVKNWICCGSTPAHTTSRLLPLALPLKNLAEIEKSGFKEVVVPCESCFFASSYLPWSRYKDPRSLLAEATSLVILESNIFRYSLSALSNSSLQW